jgi:uncharacterized protein YukE
MNFHVVPQELYEHSYEVREIGLRAQSASAAAHQISGRHWHMSYGLMCNFFPIALIPVNDKCKEVLDKLTGSVGKSADGLYKSAQKYGEVDRKHANHIAKIGIAAGVSVFDNKLLDPKSDLNYSDYMVPGPTGDKGNLNPFTSGQGGNWTSGLGVVDDAKALITDAQNQKAASGSFMASYASLQASGTLLLADPIGALAEAGAGWAIEHVKPLKIILDALAGNPDMIKGAAHTWQNISTHLTGLAKQYEAEVSTGAEHWSGEAAEAYHTGTARNLHAAMDGAGWLAKCMSVIVAVTGEMVTFVRDVVRTLISMVVAKIIKGALKRFVGLGADEVAQLQEIAATGVKVKHIVETLVEMFRKGEQLVLRAVELFKTVANIVPLLDGI